MRVDGGRVAPVSCDYLAMIGLSSSPLDVASAVAAATTSGCGGIGVFVGVVRETAAADGRSGEAVVALEYEAHEDTAGRRLETIADEARERWGLLGVSAVHRTGRCGLGEATVVVACGAPHRAEALEACRWMIDTIKTTVPIWKKEMYADGSAWVGAGS